MNSESELRESLRAYAKARDAQAPRHTVDQESLDRLHRRLRAEVTQTLAKSQREAPHRGFAQWWRECREHWRWAASATGAVVALLVAGWVFMDVRKGSAPHSGTLLASLPLASVGVARSTDPLALDRLVPTKDWLVIPDFKAATLTLPLADGTTLKADLTEAPDLEATGGKDRRVYRLVAKGKAQNGAELSATGVFEIQSLRWLGRPEAALPVTSEIERARLTLDLRSPGKADASIWSEFRAPAR